MYRCKTCGVKLHTIEGVRMHRVMFDHQYFDQKNTRKEPQAPPTSRMEEVLREAGLKKD